MVATTGRVLEEEKGGRIIRREAEGGEEGRVLTSRYIATLHKVINGGDRVPSQEGW